MFTGLQNSSIIVQNRTNTGTNFKPVYTWATYATLDAVKDLISERNQPRNEGNSVLADTVFFVDFYADINNSMRIKHGSDYYSIYQIHNPNELNRHLEIKCLKMKDGSF